VTRVLIVDDNASIVKVTRIVLEKSGYQVESADDERLFALVASWAPAIVLMDARLPHIDGVAACRRLKQDPLTAGLPIVLMTGDQSAEELAQSAGADGVLMKPFNRSDLIATIERFVVIAREES
jgi:two-component system, OmpR family, alkaline phosphatase synthesis response regulator PhoP